MTNAQSAKLGFASKVYKRVVGSNVPLNVAGGNATSMIVGSIYLGAFCCLALFAQTLPVLSQEAVKLLGVLGLLLIGLAMLAIQRGGAIPLPF